MDGLFSGSGMYLLATLLGGIGCGWLLRNALSGSHINKLNDDWQSKLKEVARQRKKLDAETVTLRASIAAQESIVHKRDIAVVEMRTELESALEREKQVTKKCLLSEYKGVKGAGVISLTLN